MPRKKTIQSSEKKASLLQTDVYDTNGKVIGKTPISKEIFTTPPNPSLLAQAVRVYLANQRSGTHSTKTRGEVTGSTRKIYRQKGTGRARHGDIKAPIFIGGGIAFGPKPRDYGLTLSRKMRRKALFSALSDKFQQGKIKVISGLENIEAKTKEMAKICFQLKLIDKKEGKQNTILLILANPRENIFLAGRNLNYLTTIQANLLNTYTVLAHKNLLFTKNAIDHLTDIFLAKTVSPTLATQKQESTVKKIATKKSKTEVGKEQKKVKTKLLGKKVRKARQK